MIALSAPSRQRARPFAATAAFPSPAAAAALGVGAVGAPLTAAVAARAYRRAKARGAGTARALAAAAVPAALGAALTGAAAYGGYRYLSAPARVKARPPALALAELSSSYLMLAGARPQQGGAPPDASGPVAARDLRNAGPLDAGALQGALPSKDGPPVAAFAGTAEEPARPPYLYREDEPTGHTSEEMERDFPLLTRAEAKRMAANAREKRAQAAESSLRRYGEQKQEHLGGRRTTHPRPARTGRAVMAPGSAPRRASDQAFAEYLLAQRAPQPAARRGGRRPSV